MFFPPPLFFCYSRINNGVTNIFERISGWEDMRENGFLHLAHRSQNPRRKDQGGGRGSEWTPSSCDHKITTSPARAGAPGPPCCTPLLLLPAMPGSPPLRSAPLRSAAVRPPLSGLRPPRLQSGPRLRGTKKSWRVVCARAARGSGAAVFSVPGAQNIDLITPRKRGHNIFGCISKLN